VSRSRLLELATELGFLSSEERQSTQTEWQQCGRPVEALLLEHAFLDQKELGWLLDILTSGYSAKQLTKLEEDRKLLDRALADDPLLPGAGVLSRLQLNRWAAREPVRLTDLFETYGYDPEPLRRATSAPASRRSRRISRSTRPWGAPVKPIESDEDDEQATLTELYSYLPRALPAGLVLHPGMIERAAIDALLKLDSGAVRPETGTLEPAEE